MDVKVNLDFLKDLENNITIDFLKFQKMTLLFNAIENGWTIKKRNSAYVFSKNHENKKEVLEDSYLLEFIKSNIDVNKVVS